MLATDNNLVHVELRDVARIQSGYLSRERVCSSPIGTHLLLQARDVSPHSGLQLNTAVRFKPERDADLYRVSCGDILLTARGQDHYAHLVDVNLDNVLASSVFYIIRPREEVVLPGYLAWYLNQTDVQIAIETASSGTGIGYLARPAIEHLPIIVPLLEMQHRITEIMNLWRQQQNLQTRLDLKRKQLIHAVCRQAVQMEKE